MSTTAQTGTAPGALARPPAWPARLALPLALAVLVLPALAAPAAAAGAVPEFLVQFGERGELSEQADPGHTRVPRGVATDPDNGHVYVADQENARINEYTSWGELVKAWGWGVRDGSAELQTCTTASGCLTGLKGPGDGQFGNFSPQGLAVDSAGFLYAADRANRRVQKFDPTAGAGEDEAAFALMFGGKVNKTKVEAVAPEAQQNRCPVDPGDVCQAGVTGTGNGQFEAWPVSSNVAIAPGDKVYVGDKERLQRFNASGEYVESLPLAGKGFAATLAAAPSGELYVGFATEPIGFEPKADLLKLSQAGAELCKIAVPKPTATATDADGTVYVADAASGEKVRQFSPACADLAMAFGGPEITASTGIAINPVGDVYVANSVDAQSYVRAYGPEPFIYGDPPKVAPRILAQSTASVGTTSAIAKAQIDAEFWPSEYYLEYGPASCETNPCTKKPLTSLDLVGTRLPATASVSLEGLAPGTIYHFRFVVQSEGGGPVRGIGGTSGEDGEETTFRTFLAPVAGSCPNDGLRSGAAALLPDCRGYEMVSPVEKNGGDIDAYFFEGFDAPISFPGLDQATPDGGKLAYSAATAFAEPEGSPFVSQYIATRGAGGWATDSIDPPEEGGIANEPGNIDSQFKAFSPDLSYGWLMPESGLPLTPGPTEGFQNLYRRENPTGAYIWLGSSAPEPEPCSDPCLGPYLLPELQGYSADGSHAVFRVNDALTAEAPRGVEGNASLLSASQTYLWSEGAPLRLVSVLPSGEPFEGVSSAGTEGSPGQIGGSPGRTDTVEHALSADGTKVYWTASDEERPKLYLRVNADQAQSAEGECTGQAEACTVQVSLNGFEKSNEAQFWTASPDGTRAIYSIVLGAQAGNLYEYTYNEATGEGKSTLIAGDTLGVAGASTDLSRLYFVSEKVLTGGEENAQGEAAQAGEPNLYLREGEALSFVAGLVEGDIPVGPVPSPVASNPRDHIARVNPDGSHLAFVSAARLTGYDNTDLASGEADREVYLYEAGEKVICASCNPSGGRPSGAALGSSLWTAAWIPGYQHQLYGRRPLSEDGSRLFFNSLDALAVQDVNGVQDVYQWEAMGTGDCATSNPTYSAQSQGCIGLISSGQSPRESEFVDASASGDDVFIRTESSLSPRDPGLVDIYDARVGGGEAQPLTPPACEGDACQNVPPAPGFASPASSSYSGPGNLTQRKPRCAKGKVRRRGRCVKRHRGSAKAKRAKRERRARR